MFFDVKRIFDILYVLWFLDNKYFFLQWRLLNKKWQYLTIQFNYLAENDRKIIIYKCYATTSCMKENIKKKLYERKYKKNGKTKTADKKCCNYNVFAFFGDDSINKITTKPPNEYEYYMR